MIVAYTDGSCVPNPGYGGWAVVIEGPSIDVQLMGHEPGTTNNRMELTAAIEAVRFLRQYDQYKICTDSDYVFRGATGLMKKCNVNHDLWDRLFDLMRGQNITWEVVKAHSGHVGNEAADLLATRIRDIGRRKARVE